MRNKFPAQSSAVAVPLHLYYTDLLPTLLFYLRNIPFPYDLFVTTTGEDRSSYVLSTCREHLPKVKVTLLVVENKGRDVKPFYTDLGQTLVHYQYLLHIHSKKS